MIMLVFLNEHDEKMRVMGKSLPDFLKGDYVKIYTRYNDPSQEKCETSQTFEKIKEYAAVFDKVIVSFGLRLFPPTAYKEIIEKHYKAAKSTVFLKKLKGSKTWSIGADGKLSFDNCRLSDTGLFILTAKDILASKTDNFNLFLQELVDQKKLSYEFLSCWVMTNKKKELIKERGHGRN